MMASGRYIPQWFISRLRDISPKLGADYNPKDNKWIIFERTKSLKFEGEYAGCRLFTTREVREPILFLDAAHPLGSGIFEMVRKNKLSHYRNLQEWMAAHGQTAARTKPRERNTDIHKYWDRKLGKV